MTASRSTVVFLGEIPEVLQMEYGKIFVEPEAGWYRESDYSPVLPAYTDASRSKWVQYDIQRPGAQVIEPIIDLTQGVGLVTDSTDTPRLRLTRLNQVSLTPSTPVIGYKVVKAYINHALNVSRAYNEHQDRKPLPLDQIYRDFIRPGILSASNVGDGDGKIYNPVLDQFIDRVLVLCADIAEQINHVISEDPWGMYRFREYGDSVLLIYEGDFRILEWERMVKEQQSLVR